MQVGRTSRCCKYGPHQRATNNARRGTRCSRQPASGSAWSSPGKGQRLVDLLTAIATCEPTAVCIKSCELFDNSAEALAQLFFKNPKMAHLSFSGMFEREDTFRLLNLLIGHSPLLFSVDIGTEEYVTVYQQASAATLHTTKEAHICCCLGPKVKILNTICTFMPCCIPVCKHRISTEPASNSLGYRFQLVHSAWVSIGPRPRALTGACGPSVVVWCTACRGALSAQSTQHRATPRT